MSNIQALSSLTGAQPQPLPTTWSFPIWLVKNHFIKGMSHSSVGKGLTITKEFIKYLSKTFFTFQKNNSYKSQIFTS